MWERIQPIGFDGPIPILHDAEAQARELAAAARDVRIAQDARRTGRDTVDVLSIAIFDQLFEHHDAGYAACLAFILFVAILAWTLLQNRALGKRVFYGE